MNIKLISLAILSTRMTAYAASTDLLNTHFKSYRPVAALFGGASWVGGVNQAISLVGTDDEMFTYRTKGPGSSNSYGGGFIGVERALPYRLLSLQIGMEYDGFETTKLQGSSLAGIQVDTSTLYQYRYRIATQQVMGAAKLLGALELPKVMPYVLHPYFNVALGAAFNKASSFTTNVAGGEGDINLTPTFADGSATQFSYNLGLGVDADITHHFRLGVGYRYSNFGQISLGKGIVTVNQYQASIGSSLNSSSVSANQFLVQLTFIA